MEPMVRDQETEKKGDMEEEAVPEAENLMRPREVAERTKEQEQEQEREQEKEKGAKSGILNNMISNFMGATTTVEGKSGENVEKFEGEDEDEKKGESSGAGILEKIISHLPEDAPPTTEEASILIHSVMD
ncbi:hypothetical protein V5N11_013053 [Cardamine amara subsp. amara]|uniref:Uncharacterized protein n=1 Tax=Cardamine amara subsp. amara TaxID=228776 RepID=A0ABD0ZYX3_CARAN